MRVYLVLLAVFLCAYNCKQDVNTKTKSADFAFKFSNAEKELDCAGVDTKLIQEAVKSFEVDIANFFTPEEPVLYRAYTQFINKTIANSIDYSALVSEHSKNVLEALKQDETLWIASADGNNVNYNHPVFSCIGDNIKESPLKITFNALLDTKSMSLRMLGSQLRTRAYGMKDDKYLATYVALELFYGKIYNKDFKSDAGHTVENTKEKGHSEGDGHNH